MNDQKKLKEIQANILKGVGRDHARYLFIRFNASRVRLRNWIRSFSSGKIKGLNGAVTSAKMQIDASKKYKAAQNDPNKIYQEQTVKCIYFSVSGFRRLGFKENELPNDDSFRKGMKHGEINSKLGDPPSGLWEEKYRQNVDALIYLAHDNNDELLQHEQIISNDLITRNIGEVLFIEEGHRLRLPTDSKNVAREHFGYIDGISQPVFLSTAGALDNTNLGLVLDNNNQGCYMVFRKLEQNVLAFRQILRTIETWYNIPSQVAGAQAIGRFTDGTPIWTSNQANATPISRLHHSYDPTGKQCPFHSHIRKVNPRNTMIPHGSSSINSNHKAITRRGITYGNREKNLTDTPSKNVGLHFICFQKSIVDQFEFIQSAWCNNRNFPSAPIQWKETGIDPIIGQTIGTQSQHWNVGWGDSLSGTAPFSFPKVVNLQFGEYFYAPAIRYLNNIFDLQKENRRNNGPLRTNPPRREVWNIQRNIRGGGSY